MIHNVFDILWSVIIWRTSFAKKIVVFDHIMMSRFDVVGTFTWAMEIKMSVNMCRLLSLSLLAPVGSVQLCIPHTRPTTSAANASKIPESKVMHNKSTGSLRHTIHHLSSFWELVTRILLPDSSYEIS